MSSNEHCGTIRASSEKPAGHVEKFEAAQSLPEENFGLGLYCNGPGPIEVFRGSMDSAKYLSIIEEHIIPHAWEMTFFQQDNAPPNKAKLVVDRFKEMDLPLL